MTSGEDRKDREIKTDAPGTMKQSFGYGRSTYEETDFHQQEEDRWIKDAADELKSARLRNDFEALAIVAPPKALGVPQECLHKEVERRIVLTVNKEMSGPPDPGHRGAARYRNADRASRALAALAALTGRHRRRRGWRRGRDRQHLRLLQVHLDDRDGLSRGVAQRRNVAARRIILHQLERFWWPPICAFCKRGRRPARRGRAQLVEHRLVGRQQNRRWRRKSGRRRRRSHCLVEPV